ncbi:phage holin family protein [Herbiconiux daphne]|uniref:Phage holin family protein n=1 Tax=Herbiconiux daphne TaxID=2970914 RepID=A0ABT2H9I2_9MICO|nr:phage holin family protein [Herbiconiux daphne]MCS5736621.1 phage holin family protein [Herbiconiux daphne]
MNALLYILRTLPERHDVVVFVFMQIADIGTGLSKAFITRKPNSKIGSRGMVKHLTILCITLLAITLLEYCGMKQFGDWFIYGNIAIYGLSIVENYKECGFWLPAFVEKMFINLKDEIDGKGENK